MTLSGRSAKDENGILLLVDTSALVHRSYHALPPLTNAKGEMVNAVYGVAMTLLSVIEELRPSKIIAAFDSAGKTFRHGEFAAYKATRKKAPEDLTAQFGYVRELIESLGIPAVAEEGFEADDIIGTLARRAEKDCPRSQIIIVTGDNDALQLVSEKIAVRTFGRGLKDVKIYDVPAVEEKYGLLPEQLSDLKGLAGDSSDNIPGVSGVGPTTARKLLQQFGTLENVYKNLSEISAGVGDKLRKDRDRAFLSKKLGIIRVDLDLPQLRQKKFLCPDGEPFQIDRERAAEFFARMNFASLLKRLGAPPAKKKSFEKKVSLSDSLLPDEETAKFFRQAGRVEYETAFFPCFDAAGRFCGGAFAREKEVKFLFYNRKTEKSWRKFFAAEENSLIVYDAKETLKDLHRTGLECRLRLYCVTLAAYLAEGAKKRPLSEVVLSVLGEQMAEGSTQQLSLLGEEENSSALTAEALDDVVYVRRLFEHYREKIEKISRQQKPDPGVKVNFGATQNWTLREVWRDMETPLAKTLSAMELWGVKFDKNSFAATASELTAKLEKLEKEIYRLAGRRFNINSPKQLAEILFEDLKLPTKEIKKTKTGISTAASELAKLRQTHPIVAAVENYRELFKIKSTYIDTLPESVASDGRIHATFHQTVTATGRLSCSDPNLQNLPARGDYTETIRSAFAAAEGYKLLSADYSQIDLRCVAHIADDTAMIAAFAAGEDIHRATAAAIHGVDLSRVTDRMRHAAKELNFGLIYGMGSYGFAQSAGITVKEAQKFIDAYFAKFTGVARYIRRTKERAKKTGYVQTPLGRRRAVPEINSPNAQVAAAGERMAINMPVQGFAADIIKLAMLAVSQKYDLNRLPSDVNSDDSPVRMILQIHDEIILEVRADQVEETAFEVKKIMENIVSLRVPLKVDIAIGDNWAQLK